MWYVYVSNWDTALCNIEPCAEYLCCLFWILGFIDPWILADRLHWKRERSAFCLRGDEIFCTWNKSCLQIHQKISSGFTSTHHHISFCTWNKSCLQIRKKISCGFTSTHHHISFRTWNKSCLQIHQKISCGFTSTHHYFIVAVFILYCSGIYILL